MANFLKRSENMNFFCDYIIVVGFMLTLALLGCLNTGSYRIPDEDVMTVNETPISNESNLEFRIQVDDQLYNVHDKIFLKTSITNTGDSSIVINKRLLINSSTVSALAASGEVYLIITSPIGDTLRFRAFIDADYPGEDAFIELKPGDTTQSYAWQDINEYYDFGKKGKYYISAYYYNYFTKGTKLKPWQGKIKSNDLVIEIQ
jgi:hypothetical protein